MNEHILMNFAADLIVTDLNLIILCLCSFESTFISIKSSRRNSAIVSLSDN